MWFKTEEKRNREDQELVKKTIQETLSAQQFQQGNLNTYTYPNQAEKKTYKKYNSRKWVSATEVAKITGLKDVKWARELMVKGYFGQVRKWGNNRNKVLREVVENTELAGRGNHIEYPNVKPLETNSLSSEGTRTKWVTAREVAEIKGIKKSWSMILINRGHFGKVIGEGTPQSPKKVLREMVENTKLIRQGRPKVNKKPKTKYLSKWINAKEVAKMKGTSPTYAITLMNKGYFGETTGKGKPYSPKKVSREVVENTELVGRGFHMEGSSSSGLRAMDFNKPKETFKPRVNPLAYEEIKNQLMEDKEFLIAVSREVMRNLKFVTKLDNE